MTPEERKAYEWALNQNFQSVAASYARTLAKFIHNGDTIPRATVAAALAELRAKLDSMMFNERHKTPFDAIQKAQVELNATIAALGLADEAEEEKR